MASRFTIKAWFNRMGTALQPTPPFLLQSSPTGHLFHWDVNQTILNVKIKSNDCCPILISLYKVLICLYPILNHEILKWWHENNRLWFGFKGILSSEATNFIKENVVLHTAIFVFYRTLFKIQCVTINSPGSTIIKTRAQVKLRVFMR